MRKIISLTLIIALSLIASFVFAEAVTDDWGVERMEIHPEAVAILEEADQMLASGDVSAAVDKYTEAIELNRELQAETGVEEFPEAYNNRGVAQFRSGNVSSARSDFETALNQYSNLQVAYVNVGYVFYFNNDSTTAKAKAQQAIDLDAELDAAYGLLGLAEAGLGNYDAALQALDQAIEKAEANNNSNAAVTYQLNKGYVWIVRDKAERDLTKQEEYYQNALNEVNAAGDMLGGDANTNARYLAFHGWIRHHFRQDLAGALNYYNQALNNDIQSIYLKAAVNYNIACVLAIRAVAAAEGGDQNALEVAKASVLDSLKAALEIGYAYGVMGNQVSKIEADSDLYTFRMKFLAEFNQLLDPYRGGGSSQPRGGGVQN